jgi:hypothetical protein
MHRHGLGVPPSHLVQQRVLEEAAVRQARQTARLGHREQRLVAVDDRVAQEGRPALPTAAVATRAAALAGGRPQPKRRRRPVEPRPPRSARARRPRWNADAARRASRSRSRRSPRARASRGTRSRCSRRDAQPFEVPANVLGPVGDPSHEGLVVLREERAGRLLVAGRFPAIAVMKRLAASRACRARSSPERASGPRRRDGAARPRSRSAAARASPSAAGAATLAAHDTQPRTTGARAPGRRRALQNLVGRAAKVEIHLAPGLVLRR